MHKVTVIVLNYIQWEETVALLNSLKQCTYTALDFILLDNASPNDSEIQLRKHFPDLALYQIGENLGYTGGVNYGIKKALLGKPEYILIINPDTIVEPDFLQHMVSAMQDCPYAAAACGTIHYLPKRMEAWYAGGRLIPWRGLAVHNTSIPQCEGSNASSYQMVTFITGCLVLLRTSCLDKIGLQDNRFFMYLDDIEYSARIIKKGYDLLYVPHAVIYHRWMTAHESAFKLYYATRNRFLLINTAFEGFSKHIARTYFAIVIMIKLSVWFFINPKFFHISWIALKDYFAGRLGKGRGIDEFFQDHKIKG